MQVGSGLSLSDFSLVGHKLALGQLLEFYIIRLGRAAVGADFLRTRVSGAAVGTIPDEFDIAQGFAGHSSNLLREWVRLVFSILP
jgi:hypothetical protein